MPPEPHYTKIYIDYKNVLLQNIKPYNPRVNLDAHLKEHSWRLCNRGSFSCSSIWLMTTK